MNSEKKLKRILLSGGGTGGHIYPALAVAEEFKKQNPGVQIKFVGSNRGLETRIIPEKGFPLYTLNIGPLHSSVGRAQQIKTILSLPLVLLHCLWILITFRPQRVMGFGGYASGPIVFMASLLFFKTSIWEANVQPGIANRLLSKFVKRCYVVFEESLKHFPTDKTKCFGYPVRQEFDVLFDQKNRNLKTQNDSESDSVSGVKSQQMNHSAGGSARSAEHLNSQKINVLVFGGSQGARILNELIPMVAAANPEFDFVLQTGLKNFDQVMQRHLNTSNLKILPFLDPIVEHYEKADIIICRSGAGALAELAAIGAHCLFVPFALASDNHQYKNALALSQRGAAGLIEEKNLTLDAVSSFLHSFKNKTSDEQRQTHQKMLAFFKPKATFNMVRDFTIL